jgi:ribosome biogenesis GTPase
MSDSNLADLGWSEFFAAQVTEDDQHQTPPARVVAAHKYAYSLANEHGSCSGVMAGRMRRESDAALDPLVVGDWILAKPAVGGTAVIVRRLERRTELARRRPLDRASRRTSVERQVLASNVDVVFIVAALDQDLSTARLERALALVWSGGATPVVLLSKADLCPDAGARQLEIEPVTLGVSVHVFSTVENSGLDTIRGHLAAGTTACLIGPSGAGKTTLINTLCGTNRRTLAVRADDATGRHATTERALFSLPHGGMLIDTPGLREIGLLEEHELSATFADIAALAEECQFANCSHRVEPGCAVLEALAAGGLQQERYSSYIKLRRVMHHQAARGSVAKQQEIKRKDKELGRRIKEYHKRT